MKTIWNQGPERVTKANKISIDVPSVVFSYKVGLLISTTRGSCCQGLDWIHVKEGRKVVFQ